MHRNAFLSERRTLSSCVGDMLGQDTLGAVTAEWPASRAGKQRISRVAETFSQPTAYSCHHISAQRRGTFLAPFTSTAYGTSGSQDNVIATKTNEFRYAESSLGGDEQ